MSNEEQLHYCLIGGSSLRGLALWIEELPSHYFTEWVGCSGIQHHNLIAFRWIAHSLESARKTRELIYCWCRKIGLCPPASVSMYNWLSHFHLPKKGLFLGRTPFLVDQETLRKTKKNDTHMGKLIWRWKRKPAIQRLLYSKLNHCNVILSTGTPKYLVLHQSGIF